MGDKKEVLDLALKQINKQFGKGSVMKLGDTEFDRTVGKIPTGSLALDHALGIGGIARGRICEIFGPEGCIAGESFLQYEVWEDNRRINHKGGTIRRLYERFHNSPTDEEPKQGRHLQNNTGVTFYVKSVNHENCVVRNEVVDVVSTGNKSCFRVETNSGQILYSTEDHKYLTPDGFRPLSALQVGSEVLVHNKTRLEKEGQAPTRPSLFSIDNHGRLHAMDRLQNLSFIVTPSVIVSIAPAGEMETYDLKCIFPHNNYIAEGIVVHNSGKTTLCLSILANAQKEDAICAFVDVEHALDPHYAKVLGVDPDELIVSQPNNAEQALQIVEMLLRSGEVDVIVLDSVAALTPAAELEGEMGDQQMGLQARIMSKAMRKLVALVSDTKSSLIFTNQIRMKIGVMFGNPETTPGGNALKFYASQRLDIRRTGQIKVGDDIIGAKTKVKVLKNRMAPPFKVAEFSLYFGEGISLEVDLMELGIKAGFITKKGAWYYYKDESLGQGMENVRHFLKSNTDIRDQIEAELRTHFSLDGEPDEG